MSRPSREVVVLPLRKGRGKNTVEGRAERVAAAVVGDRRRGGKSRGD